MKKSILVNEDKISELKNNFLFSSLADRIISLIVHGSCLYYSLDKKINKERDIDLELILSHGKANDYFDVKKVIEKTSVKVESQFRYLDEIISSHNLININYLCITLMLMEYA